MPSDRVHSRGNSGASLKAPDDSGLTLPPSPARIRGQRASLQARSNSYTIRERERATSQPETAEIPKLPGEDVDEFGLPAKVARRSWAEAREDGGEGEEKQELDGNGTAEGKEDQENNGKSAEKEAQQADEKAEESTADAAIDDESDAAFESAEENSPPEKMEIKEVDESVQSKPESAQERSGEKKEQTSETAQKPPGAASLQDKSPSSEDHHEKAANASAPIERPHTPQSEEAPTQMTPEQLKKHMSSQFATMVDSSTGQDDAIGGVSAVSHQALAGKLKKDEEKEEDEWQQMRAYGRYDVYNDDGELVAKGIDDSDDEDGGGGARKGYTKLQLDDDAESVNSMEEDTDYLFKNKQTNVLDDEEEEELRDPLQQMQATKDMLTEGQRIAYVGLTRLSIAQMVSDLEKSESTNKQTKIVQQIAAEAIKMWGQKMMVRLYAHMEIESSEQIMIEQLSEHGVQPTDLVPALMQNARVKNPMADKMSNSPNPGSQQPSCGTSFSAPSPSTESGAAKPDEPDSPPAYEDHKHDELTVQSPSTMPTTQKIDIDLRWTVLCDIFLVLIADSIYDARSRRLLETIGAGLEVGWIDICRFEKRVTDALEMQEQAHREQWDETENVESRRKMALKKRYMVMGLATVGGTLIIGLSAGLLAPVIGAGLGAGFTAIGVAGTTSFMAGAGGAAIITTASATAGGAIAIKASNRRTGAVKTFEYRPLHNNKRVNLIVTVSGWMNGKVDDVRLPFSTVDPIMGDIYSLLWEPDVLQSTGDTIRILATEALTQGLQQVLAATFLTTLMAGLSLPIILSKLAYFIDNPWSVSLDRAEAAGLILADSLIDRNLGVRPITLVGFSLGARVIFSCLKELARKRAFGLVQNVYLFGSPVVISKEEYMRARTVVSGRFLNGYATNDWILGYLFRATAGGIGRVAGLAAVDDVPGVENLNVTHMVQGHMAYRTAMPKLLREVGWEVESDEFAEIEDPDPDNHEVRQRELIREIDSARMKASEEIPTERQGKWTSFWAKRKEKKGWETYDTRQAWNEKDATPKDPRTLNDNVLFDIDAIRRELESEQMEVRQLESTLPPMRLEMQRSESAPEDLNTANEAAKNGTNDSKEHNRKPSKSGKDAKPKDEHWHEYDEAADGHTEAGMTMAFEDPNTPTWGNQAHDQPAESHDAHLAPSIDGNNSPSISPARSSPRMGNGWADSHNADPNLAKHTTTNEEIEHPRPELQRSAPSAPGDFAGGVDYNAWAAEEEMPRGGEGEMEMTFE